MSHCVCLFLLHVTFAAQWGRLFEPNHLIISLSAERYEPETQRQEIQSGTEFAQTLPPKLCCTVLRSETVRFCKERGIMSSSKVGKRSGCHFSCYPCKECVRSFSEAIIRVQYINGLKAQLNFSAQ